MITDLTQMVSRMLLLPTFVVAIAVLVKGYTSVGDGFSAGVIASLGVLLQYMVFKNQKVEEALPVRYAKPGVILGLLLVLGVTFGPLFFGQPLLTHFPPPSAEVLHFGRLEFHTAVLFDIGVFLIVLGFSVTAIRLIALLQKDDT